MRGPRKQPVRKTPVIVMDHGRLVSVVGIKHYHVVDLTEVEDDNTCPICGKQGMHLNYCDHCRINWQNASLKEIHEAVNREYPPL